MGFGNSFNLVPKKANLKKQWDWNLKNTPRIIKEK